MSDSEDKQVTDFLLPTVEQKRGWAAFWDRLFGPDIEPVPTPVLRKTSYQPNFFKTQTGATDRDYCSKHSLKFVRREWGLLRFGCELCPHTIWVDRETLYDHMLASQTPRYTKAVLWR